MEIIQDRHAREVPSLLSSWLSDGIDELLQFSVRVTWLLIHRGSDRNGYSAIRTPNDKVLVSNFRKSVTGL